MPESIDPFTRHEFPNGTCVYYRDSDHSYWRDIKWNTKERRYGGTGRLTGVTTVVSPLDFRPDNLMRWAARLNGEGIAALAAECLSTDDINEIRQALRWLESGDAIWRELENAGLLYDQSRDRKATVGTNVHEIALNALANGRPVPDLARLTDEERGYSQGIMRFWLDHEPRALQSEQVVADIELGVAGRFDLRAALHGDYLGVPLDGAICLVDAKTGAFRSTKEHAQLSGYDLLAEKCGVGACDRMFILQLYPDGDYRLLEGQGSRQAFLNALSTYRDAAAISSAAAKHRKILEQQAVAA